MRMMTVAVRIRGEVDSMPTSGLSICSALSLEREPSFARPHGRGCHTDRALPVLFKLVVGMAMQPATIHITTVLVSTSGAAETA